MKTRIIFTLSFLFCLSSFTRLVAQSKVVQDLSSDWLVYSHSNNSYFPYVQGISKSKTIHFELDLNQYKDYVLMLELADEMSVLINNKIVVNTGSNSQTYNWKIDSIQKVFNNDKVHFSIFSRNLDPEKISTLVINNNQGESYTGTNYSENFELRSEQINYDFFIISIMIILIIVIFVKRSLKNVFFEYFSFKNAFSTRPRSEAIFSIGVLSSANLSIVLMYAAVMGFSLVVLLYLLTDYLQDQFGIRSAYDLFLASVLATLFLMVLMVSKYFLISIVGRIFKLKQGQEIQYFDYLRMSLFITIIFFFLAIFSISTDGYYIVSNPLPFYIGILLLLCVRPLFIFLKLNKLSTFQNLHLFSYLCGTEIIPLIIVLKFFLNK